MSDSDNENTPIVPEPKQKFRRESLFLGVEDAFTFDFGLAADLPSSGSAVDGIGFGDDDDTPAAETVSGSVFGKEQRPPLSYEEVEALVNDSEKLSNLITSRPFSNLKGSYFIREAVENHFIDLVETLKRSHERKVSSSGPSSSRQGGKTGRHRPNKGEEDSASDEEGDKRPRTRGGRADVGRGRGSARGAAGRGRGRGDSSARGRGGSARGRAGAGRATPGKE